MSRSRSRRAVRAEGAGPFAPRRIAEAAMPPPVLGYPDPTPVPRCCPPVEMHGAMRAPPPAGAGRGMR